MSKKGERKQLVEKFSILPLLEESSEDRLKVVMFTSNVDPGKINANIKGMKTRDADNSVPFIDAHMEWGSIVKTMLGRVYDVHNGKHDGMDAKLGYIEFAKTQVGREAEILYRSGIARDVSVGIYFYEDDIDQETGWIKKSEISELSGVITGADRLAKVIQNAKMEKPDLEKFVANYNDIKPKIKQYRDLFMSDQLFEKLGIEKTGNEVEDIVAVSQAIDTLIDAKDEVKETEETQEPAGAEVENQQPQTENQYAGYMTKSEASKLFKQIFS